MSTIVKELTTAKDSQAQLLAFLLFLAYLSTAASYVNHGAGNERVLNYIIQQQSIEQPLMQSAINN
jgi:hypothetical protein